MALGCAAQRDLVEELEHGALRILGRGDGKVDAVLRWVSARRVEGEGERGGTLSLS